VKHKSGQGERDSDHDSRGGGHPPSHRNLPRRTPAGRDKKHGLWRVAEDDPDSDLYAESSDADTVMGYITAHA